MGDAETADRGLGAMADRKRKRHPRTDSRDQQQARGPADPRKRKTVGAGTNVGSEPRKKTERDTGRGKHRDEHQVVAGSRNRVKVHLSDEEHQHERNDDRAAVERPLPRLPKNDENEQAIDEVIGSSHAAIIDGTTRPVVGARVEPKVDLDINPRVEHRAPP